MQEKKRLSILGDSISTYKGISNDASRRAETAGNPYFYREPFPLSKTYWSILSERLGFTLCVNNSWSGGNLSGKADDFSGVSRARALSSDGGETPDAVIVFMGINDLGRGVKSAVFAEDYESTLALIKEKYPQATVCCVNLPDRDVRMKARTERFNEIIETCTKKMGDRFFVADLFSSRLNNDFYYMNTVDGLHPDEDGMKIIAEVLEEAFRKFF